MDEYGSRWPLWTYDAGQEDRPEWNIPGELKAELVAWTREFHFHFEEGRGWDNPATYRAHVKTGESLALRLQDLLGDEYTIELIVMNYE